MTTVVLAVGVLATLVGWSLLRGWGDRRRSIRAYPAPKALEDGDRIPVEQLGRTVLEDLDLGVRRTSLDALLEQYRDSPVTQQVLETLKGAAVGELRLRALTITRDIPGIEDLVRSPAMPSSARAEGLVQLRRWSKWSELEPIVRACLATDEPTLIRAALPMLGTSGDHTDVPALKRFLESGDGETRDVAKVALAVLQRRLADRVAGSLTVVDSSQGGELAVAQAEEEEGRLSVARQNIIDKQ